MLDKTLKQLKDLSVPVARIEIVDEALSYFACCRLEQAMCEQKDSITVVKLKSVTLDKPKLTLLFNTVKSFTNLVELDLSGNPLSDDVAELLQHLWLNLPNLKTLSLANTGIGIKTAQAIVEVLCKNPILQRLDISSNALTDEAGIILCAALTINTRLQYINITKNDFKDNLSYALNFFNTIRNKKEWSAFQNSDERLRYFDDELMKWCIENRLFIDKIEKINIDYAKSIHEMELLPKHASLVLDMDSNFKCPDLGVISDRIIWDIPSQNKLQDFPEYDEVVATLDNGQFVTSNSSTNQSKVWQFDPSVQQWKDVQTIKGEINQVLVLPEGQAIGSSAASTYKSNIMLLDITSVPWKVRQWITFKKAQMKVVLYHNYEVFISSSHPDPISSGAIKYTMDIWVKASDRWQQAQSISLNHLVEKLLVNTDGTLLSGGNNKMTILKKNISGQWQILKVLDFTMSHTNAEPLLGITKDLAIICTDDTAFLNASYRISLWDMTNNQMVKQLDHHLPADPISSILSIFKPINAKTFITRSIGFIDEKRDTPCFVFKLWHIKIDFTIRLIHEIKITLKCNDDSEDYPWVLTSDNRLIMVSGSNELALFALPSLDMLYLVTAVAKQVMVLQKAAKKLDVETPIGKKKNESGEFIKYFAKTSSKTNPMIPTLRGEMPNNNNNPITFEEHFVSPNGDCGFTALGVDRQKLAEVLLLLKNNDRDRESLAEEIQNAFMSKEMELPDDSKGQPILKSVYDKQNELDIQFRSIRETLTDDAVKKLDYDALISWLQVNHKLDEAQTLIQKRLQLHQAECDLMLYCQSPYVFGYYIKLLGTSDLWLGYKSALLYAREASISLYIWKKSQGGGLELNLHDHYRANPSAQNEIHMIFTDGFTHFNLLSKSSIEKTPKFTIDSPIKKVAVEFLEQKNNSEFSMPINKLTILSLNLWNGGSKKAQSIAKVKMALNKDSDKDVKVKPEDLEEVFKYFSELIYWNKADIVALQEVDRDCERTLKRNATDIITEHLNNRLQVNNYPKSWSHYFVSARKCGNGQYGNAILTKIEKKHTLRYTLERANNIPVSLNTSGRRINREKRAAVCTMFSLTLSGSDIPVDLWIINTHLGLEKYDQSHQIDNLVKIINNEAQYLEKDKRKTIISADAAIILCGDFNIEEGTKLYRDLLYTLNNSNRTDFKDLGPKKTHTFKSKKIDYAFFSDPNKRLGDRIKTKVISSEGYSDHKALKITFSF